MSEGICFAGLHAVAGVSAVTAHDDVFEDAAINPLRFRMDAAGSTPPSNYQKLPRGGSFTLPTSALVGDWIIEVVGADPARRRPPP